jgi:hypothetical protein
MERSIAPIIGTLRGCCRAANGTQAAAYRSASASVASGKTADSGTGACPEYTATNGSLTRTIRVTRC